MRHTVAHPASLSHYVDSFPLLRNLKLLTNQLIYCATRRRPNPRLAWTVAVRNAERNLCAHFSKNFTHRRRRRRRRT
jgi:hypothetical protein